MPEQDIDLQKIQVLESCYQGWFNLKASLMTGVVIGFLILIATMSYEKVINFQAMAIGYCIVFLAMGYMLYDMNRGHETHVQWMDELLIKIEKGERLASIDELRKSYIKQRNTKARRDQEKKSCALFKIGKR